MNEKQYMLYFKTHIKEKYKLPDNTKIAFYQNPKDFKIEFIEDINPSHVKIIYGKRWDNCGNCEKIARILIPSVVISELFVMSLLLAPVYFNLFALSFLIGIYLSDIHTMFVNIDKFFEVFTFEKYVYVIRYV